MGQIIFKAQEFTTPGTSSWTVPDACSGWVYITSIGGGGGTAMSVAGFGYGGFGPGGGGAGETVQGQMLKCTPGGTLSITVGAGGAGGTSLTSASYLPLHATIGSKEVGGIAEEAFSANDGSGSGGKMSKVGEIRALGGAGDGAHGGTGAGSIAYGISAPFGNQGEQFSDANVDKPAEKEANRFYGGAGGGGGSKGTTSTAAGKGGPATAYISSTPGAVGTGGEGGGGGGGASFYGAGGNGGQGGTTPTNPPSAGTSASAYGAGGGGAGYDNESYSGPPFHGGPVGSNGGDGYVLLSWYEVYN